MATSEPMISPGNRAPYPIPFKTIQANMTPGSDMRSVSTQPRPPVIEWASATRERIDRDVADRLRASSEDITDLVEEICAVFITALQKNRITDWRYVKDVLGTLHPYARYLKHNQQVTHYVDRIFYHLQQHSEKLEALNVMDAIIQVFPEDAKHLMPSGGDKRNFRTPTPPPEPRPSIPFIENPMLLPDGKDPYLLEQPGEEAKMKPKGLCMGDLKDALPIVVMETTKREAVWSEGLGLTAAALSMDLPSKPKPVVPDEVIKHSSRPSSEAPSWTKEAVFLSDDHFTISEADADEFKPLAPMTGKQAVELFGQGRHLGKATFVYLNKTPNRHYRPYDLTVVPKHKANAEEHWIVSCFGIMHKIAAKPAQGMALYEWHREAVLWATITKIPFYKYYLIQKAFIRWQANHKFNQYAKIREKISQSVLLAVPNFGAPMLQISKLLKELITVRMLPLELDRCYTLAEFEHAAQDKKKYGENILGKFFSYCKLIVEKTCEDSLETLRFCEAQAKKDKALFSKESLYIQRQKKEQREQNLKKAQEESSRLGNLVQLVDKMLQCHLLEVTRTNITSFVNETMCEGVTSQRNALFVVKLIFSPKSILTLFPTKEQFSGTLLSILRDIPTLISEMAQPMENIARGWLGDDEQKQGDIDRLSQAGHYRSASSHSDQTSPAPSSKFSQKPTTAGNVASTMPPESRFTMATRSGMPPESRVTMTTRSIAGWTSLAAGESIGDGVITEPPPGQEDVEGEGDDEGREDELADISEPILDEKAQRSKSSDDFGVATPDLCMKSDFNSDLIIQGRGVMGQFNPLETANLLERLSSDEVVREALKQYQHIMESAMRDIDKFCDEQSWLTEIHRFTRTWDPRAVKDWKRAQAYTIETKLGEIRSWMERVRNVDRGFTTRNGLFHVDCGAIQEDIVPALMSAFKDLLNFTAGEARKFSMAFINEVKAVVDGMKEKDTSMHAFADYAQQYSTYKNKMPDLQKEVEYIKSLFEVIRLSYRSLNVEEEKCEEKVWQSWEAFLLQLQDAAEFVNTQTPIQLGDLQDKFQKLKKDAEKISTAASSGPFLDPDENPTALLATIKQYFDQFYAVQTQMMECSKYKEKITGTPYDTSRLGEMLQKMKVRAELWKYVEVSSHAIKDWKSKVFKKMNVSKALDKVTEWQHAAGQLKQLVPQGDQVLTYWYRLLSDFKQDLPLLLKLSSDALKPRHWKALFVSLGQVYQPLKMYTVTELISFNLREHSLQINSICSGAAAEFALEQSLIKLRKLWEEKEFKLAKHIPIVKQKKLSLGPEKNKKGNRKAARDMVIEQSLTTDVPDMFILIGDDELQYILEDNLVALQSMLVSPHLADLRPEAEVWCATLRQVEDMVDVWMHCQRKWQYLSHIFIEGDVKEKFAALALRFADVDLQYQDIMKAVSNDPKVLSILSKRKGQKGRRELQGDVLKDNLLQLITYQEEILKAMESFLTQTRTAFPRFFFLSDEEVIDILCMTRDKRRWLPAVKKLFTGIENLTFDLPPDKDDITTAFDINLNADRLQVVAVEGMLGEQVNFMSPLTPKCSPVNWFSGLERNLKTALGSLLHACLETRLREGSKAPEKILEELTIFDRETPEPIANSKEHRKLKSAMKRSFRHWLLRFPVQCVITAETVLWEKEILAVLRRGDKEALMKLRDQHQVRLDQYTSLLRDNCGSYMESESRGRLQILLSGLLAQYIHQRDITESLLSLQEPTDKVFDWLKTLRYHMDAVNVRCLVPQNDTKDDLMYASIQGTDSTPDLQPKKPISATISSSYIFGPCTIQQMDASFTYEYEYLGPAIRLAATPLTDRCHVSLAMTMQSSQCGTVIGPAQTGKSETVKEFAKIMGRQLFSFDCTEASNISVLNQQLCGVVQSGCWAVFTNVQHMAPGLMSVFGQQLQVLCHAYGMLQCKGNQYGSRAKENTNQSNKPKLRRNSVTTLHSMQNCPKLEAKQKLIRTQDSAIPQMTQRRHSVGKEQDLHLNDFFKADRQHVPLFDTSSSSGPLSQGALQMESAERTMSPLMPFKYKPSCIGHIKFDGMLMKANPQFGCFMTIDTSATMKNEIPLTLRMLMRPIAMVMPDRRIILETVLHCQGFRDAKSLAGKMITFADLLEAKYPCKYSFGLHAMKSAINIATHRLYARRQVYQLTSGRDSQASGSMALDGTEDPMDFLTFGNEEDHKEESAMVFAIQAVLLPSMGSIDDVRAIRNLLRSVCPWGGGSRPGTAHENDPVLMDAIQTQFVADKLQATPRHVAKVLELYDCLQHNSGVILVGPAGSGKTVCYETLSRVLNTLHFIKPVEERIQSPMKGPRIESASSTPRPSSTATNKVRRAAEALSKVTKQWTDTVSEHAGENTYPRVDVSVLFPGALSVKELMGCYNEEEATWHDGILTRLVRNADISSKAAKHFVEEQAEKKKNKILLNPPSVIDQWIVMDGELSVGWSEGIGPWIEPCGITGVNLGHGEQLKLAESSCMIFETMDLTKASPAIVTRCAVVHLSSHIVHWKFLVESWMGSAKAYWEINNDGLDLLKSLISDTFGPTLDFITNQCSAALTTDLWDSKQIRSLTVEGVQEVSSFLRILSALCDKHFMNEEFIEQGEEEDPKVAKLTKRLSVPELHRRRSSVMSESSLGQGPSPVTLMSSMFAFAYVWSFGGHLHNRCASTFDQFAREQLSKATNDVHFPSDGLVYDYCIDSNLGILVPWGDKNQDRVKTLSTNYAIIPEVERYSGLVDLLVGSNYPVLLTGPPGVGKTALMQHWPLKAHANQLTSTMEMIKNLVQPKHSFVRTSLSPGLTCGSFEDYIVSKLRPRSIAMTTNVGAKQPKNGGTHLFFIDDLHCGKMDVDSGVQPCIEVLRQLMTTGGVYDRQRLHHKSLESANFIAACVPPSTVGIGSGTSSHALSPRITRLFSVLSFFVHSEEAMQLMHGSSLQGWLEEFPAYSLDHHKEMAQALLSATLKLHSTVVTHFPSSPINPQYVFSHHDIQGIINGLYLMSPRARARPRHGGGGGGGRRGGGAGGGGRPQGAGGRRIGRPGAAGQAKAMLPPMMRTVVRLWCHETTRTYADRIVCEEDQSWFSQTLLDTVEKHFCTGQGTQPIMLRELSTGSSSSQYSGDSLLSLSALEADTTPVYPSDILESSMDEDELTNRTESLIREDSKMTITSTITDIDTISYTEDEGENEDDAETRSSVSMSTGASDTDGSAQEDEQLEGQETVSQPPDGGTPTSTVKSATSTAPSSIPNGFHQPSPPSSPPPSKILQPTPPASSGSPRSLLPARKDASPSRVQQGKKHPPPGRRRTVTFQLGHLGDSRCQDMFNGPLMSMDQVLDPGENPCDIIFAKNIISGQGDGRGYIECREEQMYEGIQKTLSQYNTNTHHKMELVFFKEALRHIARLSRVLSIHGGNALLISLANGTGRSSLTTLAAYTARCKMFDATSYQDRHNEEIVYRAWVRDYIKRASNVAGLAGKPAVLFVRGNMPTSCLQDVCAFMNQGTCPDLYTREELDHISTQMLPGSKVTGQRSQRLEMALERFYKKVLFNLHVVIALDCSTGSVSEVHQKLQEFPSMLNSSCCVDVYRPWSHEALVHVAEQWLRVPTADVHTLLPYKIPWSTQNTDSQVTALSHAMAYMHQTALGSVNSMYRQHYKLFSPLTYLEFIDLFKNLACKIGRDEKTTINKYEEALDRLNDAFENINNYNKEVLRLKPQHDQAVRTAELRLSEVDECRAILGAARDDCREDEKDIASMQEPLDGMKEQAQAELDKVNPIYEAALHALNSLSSKDLDEIRTYQKPPMAVIKVVNAICLMFREPYDWQSGKTLINRSNFFQDLEFYEKANMPDDIYHKLNVLFIQDPDFTPQFVSRASAAASSLCMWVHAVYAYASLHRNMRPKLNDVEMAEAKLQEAQGHLGQKRVKAQDVRGVLDEKTRQYKESIRQVRKLEHSIKNIETKIATATNLMTNMSAQHSTWKFNLEGATNNLTTAPGDALVTAACVCYQGPMNEQIRHELFADWLERCRSGNFSSVREESRRGTSSVMSSVTPALDEVINANDSQYLASSRTTSALDSRNTSRMTSRNTNTMDTANSGRQTSGSYASMDDNESLGSDALLLGGDTNSSPTGSRDVSRITSSSAAPLALYPVAIREDFTLEAILSNPEEQVEWKEAGMCRDLVNTRNALFMRTCCIGRKRQWPLILDPDNQVLHWVKLLQEKDVVSFHVDEDIENGDYADEDMDLADHIGDDRDYDNKPESRGTTIGTLSEHGESSIGTDFHGTPRTLTSYGADTPFRDTLNNIDLQDISDLPKTPFEINLDIERPADNLWIIPADDPNLEIKLIQAVVLGICLVVTHIERKGLCVRFNHLISRNVAYDQGGKRKILIGGTEYEYSSRFKLYLCSSVPLELAGAGLIRLPIQQASVIDLSVSPQGLTDHLLRDILAFEKPELEGQWRSIEKDIRDQELSLQQADDEVLAKILALPHGILEEPTMLETLQEYQQMTLTTDATLLESQQLAKQHHLKQSFYVPVAEHGTLLYSIMKQIAHLHPLYQIPLTDFVAWFHDIIWSHQKDSTNISSPKARAVELINSLTQRIHERVAVSFFQPHSDLFAFLLAAEKMRLGVELSRQEWELFVHGVDDVALETQQGSRDNYPDWMTDKMLLTCSFIENNMSSFKGLRDSLTTHCTQWMEYLQCDPVLLAPVPGEDLLHLTVMQKALLWRLLKPAKLAQVCSDLTVYQLGAHLARPKDYSIDEIVRYSNNTTPVVFVLPSNYCTAQNDLTKGFEGHTPIYPTQALLNYTKAHRMDTQVNIVNLGTSKQMENALAVVKECMARGKWVVLDNCHLAGQWSKELLDCIQDIITSNHPMPIMAPRKPPPPSAKPKANNEEDEEKTEVVIVNDDETSINPRFRLFLVTTADSKIPLPGLIVQHSMKVSCEATINFKSALLTNFNISMKNMEKIQPQVTAGQKAMNEIVFSVALLHTVLSQRRLYHRLGFSRDYQWSQTDLVSALKVIQTTYDRSKESAVIFKDIRYILTHVVYGGCIDCDQDVQIIKAMVDSCIAPWKDAKMMPPSMGIPSLLASISQGGQRPNTSHSHGGRSRSRSDSNMSTRSSHHSHSQSRRFQRMFDSMKNQVQASHLGLMSGAPDVVERTKSRFISACLHTLNTTQPNLNQIFPDTVTRQLHFLLETINAIPSFNPPPADSLSHLQNYLANELSCYCNLVATIESDVSLLLQAASGLVARTPKIQTLLLAINEDSVPQSWLPQHVPSCIGVQDWLLSVEQKMEILQSWCQYENTIGENAQETYCYNLAIFWNPRLFVKSLLQEHARKEYIEVFKLKLQAQILGSSEQPASPPDSGVYITGLQLHNAGWNPQRAAIQLFNDVSNYSALPTIWLKPSVPSLITESSTHPTYTCPVYAMDVCRGDLVGDDVVMNIDLPCTLDSATWVQKRVYAVANL